MTQVEGTVLDLICLSCESHFSTFQFSGDTDMVIVGLASATSDDGQELIIGELTPDELSDPEHGHERFARRVSDGRQAHYNSIKIINWIGGNAPAGISFQEFRRVYEAPEPAFRCPRCGGEAHVKAERTPSEFVALGGTVHFLGDLRLKA